MRSRKVACLVAVLLICAVFLSCAFLSFRSHHDCTGEDCPVCLAVSRAQNTLGGALGWAAATFALTCFSKIARLTERERETARPPRTPVALCVKLSD